MGVHRDLYTSVASGRESDRIETWLNEEVETPALPVLNRLRSQGVLATEDRKKLARYLASLAGRHPLWYAEHTRVIAENIEGVLNKSVERAVEEVNESAKTGRPLSITQADWANRFRSLTTKFHPASDASSTPMIEVRAVIGREIWLESIEHIVNDVSLILENHNWQVFRPYPRWTWYTSDHPLIRLNAYPNGKYDFKGGFGNPGGELLLPLSPSSLLYAHIDRPRKEFDVFSLELTLLIKRFIAQNAFRWIVTDTPRLNAEWFRPRVVNLEQYCAEESSRSKFHDEQSAAERDLRTPDA